MGNILPAAFEKLKVIQIAQNVKKMNFIQKIVRNSDWNATSGALSKYCSQEELFQEILKNVK